MTPQPRSTISLGDIIYKAEAKAGTKASRSPFDVPIDYTPNRQGNVASSSTSSETKFVPAFHHKGEVQFAPRVKRGDGSHKAVTVSEGGKTVKVEVNYKVCVYFQLPPFQNMLLCSWCLILIYLSGRLR